MSFRNVSARFTADTAEYSAGVAKMATETRSFAEQAVAAGQVADKGMRDAAGGTVSYTEAVKVASRTEAEAAATNVEAAAKRRESLVALRAEYVKLAAAAEEGSAQQLAAMRLQEVATKRLGESQLAVASEAQAASVGQLTTRLATLTGTSNTATRGIAELSKGSDGAKAAFMGMSGGTLAAGAGLLALGVGAEQGVKKLLDLGAETRVLQRITGGTAEDTSRFVFELKSVGLTSEQAIPAMARFTRNVQDHAEKFDQAGVAIKRNNDGTVNVLGTYDNLRDRLRGVSDAGERQSIIFALMGRGANVLSADLTLTAERLKQLREQSDGTGATISEKTSQQTLQLSRSMNLLGAEVTGLELKLGEAVLPTLTNVTAGLVSVGEKANKATGWIGGLNSAFDFGVQTLSGPYAGALDLVQGHYKDAALHASGLGTVVGHLSGQFETHTAASAKVAKMLDDQKLATAGLKPFAEALSEAEDISTLSSDKLAEASAKLRQKLDDAGASIGFSGDQLLQWGGGDAQVAVDGAKKVAAAVESASQAFSKDFSITDAFSASALESMAKTSTKSADSITKDDTRVSDATQHVADLQAQYAEQASSARDAYTQKVESANQAMTDADQRYADTVTSENQRVADADQKLADERINAQQRVQDAKDRLATDDTSGAQSVADAQQRLRDLMERNAATTPAQSAAVSKAQELRRAQEDIAKAQDKANDTHQKDVDAIAKAEADGVKTVAKAQEDADKARVTQAQSVTKAEEQVTKAREAQNKLAAEGNTIGQMTLSQQTEMRKAVEAVTRAQQGLGGAIDGAGDTQRESIKLTTDQVRDFYAKSTTDADKFSQGIKTAIKQGYDPDFIGRLMQEGPKAAAPILELIVGQNDSTLRDMVNKGEQALKDMNFNMREGQRLTYLAVTNSSDQMNRDLSGAYRIMEANSGEGGAKTRQALSKELGLAVGDVERISNEFKIKLGDGINPILQGIGAKLIDLHVSPFAQGGAHLPSDARLQPPGTLIQWAEPETQGEYFIPRANDHRRPNALNVLSQAADDFGYTMLRKFATGGFNSVSDIPVPSNYPGLGDMVGAAGDRSDHRLYDLVADFVRAHPQHSFGVGATGSHYGFQALIDYINSKGISNVVTSTVRPGSITTNGNLSEHALGMAADFAGDMPAITAAFNEIGSAMRELIHDPGGSIKMGQPVDPSFWGPLTWSQHGNHVHAATFHGPDDGPGIPGGSDALAGAMAGAAGGGDARAIGRRMAEARGWGSDAEWSAIDNVFTHESGWDPNSVNPSSGAYGIPQANPSGGQGHPYALGDIPGQIQWGYDYMADRYVDPIGAWNFWQAHQWYAKGGLHGAPGGLTTGVMDQGGWLMPGANLNWNGTGTPERILPPGATHNASSVSIVFEPGSVVLPAGTTREQVDAIMDALADRAHDMPGGSPAMFARAHA